MLIQPAAKAAAAHVFLATASFAAISPACAQEPAPFCKNKTVEVYAGASPGSGYAGYACIIARPIPRVETNHRHGRRARASDAAAHMTGACPDVSVGASLH